MVLCWRIEKGTVLVREDSLLNVIHAKVLFCYEFESLKCHSHLGETPLPQWHQSLQDFMIFRGACKFSKLPQNFCRFRQKNYTSYNLCDIITIITSRSLLLAISPIQEEIKAQNSNSWLWILRIRCRRGQVMFSSTGCPVIQQFRKDWTCSRQYQEVFMEN